MAENIECLKNRSTVELRNRHVKLLRLKRKSEEVDGKKKTGKPKKRKKPDRKRSKESAINAKRWDTTPSIVQRRRQERTMDAMLSPSLQIQTAMVGA